MNIGPFGIGDVVESLTSGKRYVVVDRWKTTEDRRQYEYEVVDIETGRYPNTFKRHQIKATGMKVKGFVSSTQASINRNKEGK